MHLVFTSAYIANPTAQAVRPQPWSDYESLGLALRAAKIMQRMTGEQCRAIQIERQRWRVARYDYCDGGRVEQP